MYIYHIKYFIFFLFFFFFFFFFIFFFFFFQAEVGIRDFHVTGVQTCALPISTAAWPTQRAGCTSFAAPLSIIASMDRRMASARPRSEERRVGKECRSRWS